MVDFKRTRARRSRLPRSLQGNGDNTSTLYPVLNLRSLWRSFAGQSAAFKLACLYLFFEYVRPQSIWRTIDVLPFTQITILTGVMIAFASDFKSKRASTPVPAFLAFFTVALLNSVVFAYSPAESIAEWTQFVPWLLVYALITWTVTTRERWLIFVLLFLLCSLKMSQHGFRTWAGRGFASEAWGVTGAPGFFQNSAEFGIQMAIFLPLSLAFYQQFSGSMGRIGKLFFLAMPLTAAGSIIATNSRGAVVGGLCAMGWYLAPKGARLKGILSLSALAIMGYLIIPDEFLSRFFDIGTDATSQSRLTYWKDGLEIIAQHPFSGIGFANWPVYYGAYYGIVIGSRVEVSHNTLIQAGSELGLPGLIAVVLLGLSVFRVNAATARISNAIGDTFATRMCLAMDAAMVGFIVSAQFVAVLYYPFLWIALALSVALRNAVQPVDLTHPRRFARRSSFVARQL